jgi:hypothetical protein
MLKILEVFLDSDCTTALLMAHDAENLFLIYVNTVVCSGVPTEGGGGVGVFPPPPPPEIPKALQNRAKLNPIVKIVKNYWI